jgi:hypothetical protein
LPHLRAEPSYRFLLDELQEEPIDTDVDDPGLAENPAAFEDRRDVECVLTRSEPATENELKNLHRTACEAPGGRYARPVAVIDGDIELSPDPIDLLRATVAVGASHVSTQPTVVEVMDTARAFLASPGIPGGADVAVGLAQRIRATFDAAGVATAASFEDATELALVDKRSRNFRQVCGGRFIRARVQLSAGGSLVCYLPDALDDVLPANRKVAARAVVRVHAGLEEHEAHAITLEVLALASRARAVARAT